MGSFTLVIAAIRACASSMLRVSSAKAVCRWLQLRRVPLQRRTPLCMWRRQKSCGSRPVHHPFGVPAAEKAIQVFDSEPRHLKLKLKIPLEGSAEGYAVDNQR